MRLKQVRLSGFKSFCDSTDLDFDANGITMVVGPNGCGKSNVVDAVRWALGEQSPRLMRSTAMGDVIFAGSTSRKPVGRAEVTLLFDNADRTAIEKYNEYTEIAVTRRLYRSGESEYLINKLPSRLMDIRELVMDTGAAGRSYSIVEQGRVDEFVTASPQDRRAFMEEAAGIVRYKTKRAAAEKKLEQTRQNLLRVEDVLGELGRQEAALRDQMEAAREFRDLQRDAELLRGDLARLRHAQSARICTGLETQRTGLADAAGAEEQRLLREQAELEGLSIEQAQHEQALRESRGRLYGKEREIQQTETQLALERQNATNTRAWTAELERTRADLRQHAETFAATQSGQAAEAEALDADLETARQEIARVAAEHDTRELALQDASHRLSALQEQLVESHTQITGCENQQRFLAERRREDEDRRTAVHARINAVATELEQMREAEASQRARGLELQAAQTDLDAERDALRAELEQEQTALAAHRVLRQAAEQAVLESRSRLQSLEEIEAGYEDFAEHVRTFLQWVRETPEQGEALGVVGPLADLITVPAQVAAWSGDYLAPHLDTVVVRSAAALPALAEQVAALEAGGVRFLALDALPAPANGDHPGDERDHDGLAALAALLQAEGASSDVLAAMFGSTHVLGEGAAPHPMPRPLGKGHEWIAADGAFHVDGRARVTLGSAASAGAGMLRRRGEMAELRERLHGQEGERERLDTAGTQLGARIEGLEARHAELVERTGELALTRKGLEQELAQAARENERLGRVREAVEREAAQFEGELERNHTQQAALAEQVETWRETRTRLEGQVAGLRGEVDGALKALQTVADDLTQRKVAQGGMISRLEGLRTRLADLERERAERGRKLEETDAALAAQTAKLAATEAAIAALESALKDHHTALEGLRQTERERKQGFETLADRHRALTEQVKESQRRHDANQTRLHEIELKLTAERMRMEQHAEQLAGLPERGAGDPPPPTDEAALESRLTAAQAKLKRMEGVNLGAPEEYEALSTRMTFLHSQQADLNGAIENLEGSIRRMNTESRRRFRDTFEQVNEKFQALFPQVFGGGEARLVLTDSEDALVAGVDIVAQPPGKKLQSISLLSGGEKALTAISLIFAFFMHKPSPFCLLDEVDAPLDDVNVTRFNRLIQSMTDHSQFIIITHNKRTMEVADRLYGVTMEEAGVSKIVSVNLSGVA